MQMIYFFGHWTSPADGAFYLAMLLPAYNHLTKRVPATLPFGMASLLFYAMSLAVSFDWGRNFTVPTSYLFYMLMPFWALTAILAVEVGGTLADLTNKPHNRTEDNRPPETD